MNWALLSIVVIAGIALLFIWGNRRTARAHARFQTRDVEEALAELVSPNAEYFDAWDLFLAWPIDDPQLESIRQRCLAIVREHPPRHPREYVSDEAEARVASLLEELRSRSPQSGPTRSVPTANS